MVFEWNARKSAANRRKHGISFREAVRIFDGPVLEREDDRDPDEMRWIAFGQCGPPVLVVVYTWRGEARRMISARKATRNESQAYFEVLYQAEEP